MLPHYLSWAQFTVPKLLSVPVGDALNGACTLGCIDARILRNCEWADAT